MDGRDIVGRGYDDIAKVYLESRCTSSEDIGLIDDFIDRLPENAIILDAGCGAGVPVARKLSRQFNVVGVDFSKSQIDLAKVNVPDGKFFVKDLTKLHFPENHFDAIISYYAIIHIPREEHKGIIESFYKILKPDGIMLLCTGANDLKDDINEDYLGTKMYWSHYDSETNKKMVEDIGFKIIWVKEIGDESCEGGNHLFILAKKICK